MAEGHGRDEWSRWSVLLALTANCHRDPSKGQPLKPGDFDPFGKDADRRREGALEVDSETIGDLKVAFESFSKTSKTPQT